MNLNLKHLVAAFMVATVCTGLFQASVAATPAAPQPVTQRAYTGPCHDAVRAYWPAAWRPWAHAVVHRESRGIPTAANRRSSARGCFQMLLRYSNPFYKAVGCTNYNWSSATCNVRAALVMRQRHGTRPWAVR